MIDTHSRHQAMHMQQRLGAAPSTITVRLGRYRRPMYRPNLLNNGAAIWWRAGSGEAGGGYNLPSELFGALPGACPGQNMMRFDSEADALAALESARGRVDRGV